MLVRHKTFGSLGFVFLVMSGIALKASFSFAEDDVRDCSKLLRATVEPRVLTREETILAVTELLNEISRIEKGLDYRNLVHEGDSSQPWPAPNEVDVAALATRTPLARYRLSGSTEPSFLWILERGHDNRGLEELLKKCRSRPLAASGAGLLAALGSIAVITTQAAVQSGWHPPQSQHLDTREALDAATPWSVIGAAAGSGVFVFGANLYFGCSEEAKKQLAKNFVSDVVRVSKLKQKIQEIGAAAKREVDVGLPKNEPPIHEAHRLEGF